MTLTAGCAWNLTMLDGKTVTWVKDGDYVAVASVLDPESDRPARRILKDGSVQPLGETQGLTVYGTHAWDRPVFDRFREIAPEYAYLVDGIERGRGITHHRFTAGENTLLTSQEVAARIGVSPSTVHRYKSRGTMPKPDDYKGRTPLWRPSTIDGWKRPGRGNGGGRPAKK